MYTAYSNIEFIVYFLSVLIHTIFILHIDKTKHSYLCIVLPNHPHARKWGFTQKCPLYCECEDLLFKGPFCNPNMLFLWHKSIDRDKISVFPNFQSIPRLRKYELCLFYWIIMLHRPQCCQLLCPNRHFDQLFHKTNEFARNICTQILCT